MAQIVSHGTQTEVLNLTLSSTTDTQVGFTHVVHSVTIHCRTAVDLQLRTSANAPFYFTIPSATTFTIQIAGSESISGDPATPPSLPIWLRSASTSPVVEILGIYGG